MPKQKLDKFPSESELLKGVDIRKYTPRIQKLIKKFQKKRGEAFKSGMIQQNMSDSAEKIRLQQRVCELEKENSYILKFRFIH